MFNKVALYARCSIASSFSAIISPITLSQLLQSFLWPQRIHYSRKLERQTMGIYREHA